MADLRRSANKDIRQILKKLDKAGCAIVRSNSGHWRVSRDGCQTITVANSPMDPRTILNVRADVKRYLGIVL